MNVLGVSDTKFQMDSRKFGVHAFQWSGVAVSNGGFLRSTKISGGLLRIALVTIAGVAFVAPAKAGFFWSDDDPMMPRIMMEPEPQDTPKRPPRPTRPVKTAREFVREHAKPVGPLVISISLERQSLRVYDANGLFAETPVSTGMRGHTTPMGVFSIIQKNKWHRSNIYSGAPMPYMQRVTWSGIAMHAGSLPGYAASHGCIRMPMSFATKIWAWTRMGTRVIITPGEISPADFSHPLLATQKPAAQSLAAATPKDPATTTPAAAASLDKAPAEKTAAENAPSDKATIGTTSTDKASIEKASIDKASIDKASADKARAAAATDSKPAEAGLTPSTAFDRTKTADASSAMASANASPVLSDASKAGTSGPVAREPDDQVRVTRRDVDEAAAKVLELAKPEAPANGPAITSANGPAAPAAETPAELASAKPAEPAQAPTAATATTAPATSTPVSTATTPAASATTPAATASASGPARNTHPGTPDVATAPAPAAQATTTPAAAAPAPATQATAAPAATALAPAPAADAAPKRSGQIAVLVSGKDGKLYVRQGFAPLFETPIAIKPSDHPLGTHVFTARVDKDEARTVHWSAMSLPTLAHRADADDNLTRRRKSTGAIEVKPRARPNSAAEALDRLTIPADAMVQITEALASGGSIIVSDQALAAGGETGQGTEFVVPLR